MAQKGKLSSRQIASLLRLYHAGGWTAAKLAERYEVTVQTVRYHIAKETKPVLPPVAPPAFEPQQDGWDDVRRLWAR